MHHWLFIALGGALGALGRYAFSNAVNQLWTLSFPLATLLVNALGSFAMGIMYVIIVEQQQLTPEWRSIVMVGLLGAFTTFSTFSLETVVLLQRGDVITAISYTVISVMLCAAACWLAITVCKTLF
ncbi:MAG TPA: fluoride efflux transporter CrcB [Pseudomonadales bacterium]|nr:fluoride efflux transporter CrcB [Pseudomonadales bacterium]